jgi:hypothetical protein
MRNSGRARWRSPLVIGLLIGRGASTFGQPRIETGNYQQNASFLSRRFLTDAKNVGAMTDDFVRKAYELYKVRLLFPNGGLLNSDGTLDHAPFSANIFLEHVNAYEHAKGTMFTLMPYLNAYSFQDAAHAANLRVNLEDRAVRAHIVAECAKYVSTSVPGSHVRGSKRVFDGIVLDIEPGGDPAFLASLKTLLAELRTSFLRMGLANKKIGFAAPQYTERVPKPNWGWDSSDYHSVARYIDYVIAMTYDSGLKDESKYQPWMKDQTTHILRAVSGATRDIDTAHPSPTNAVRVLIGLPGFQTVSKAHDPDVENVAHGAPGILEALALLRSQDRTTLNYFQGVTMYTHDGGSADSNFARYDKDWSEWKKYWLDK